MPVVSPTSSRFSRGRCTSCGSYELHRSRPRTPLERFLRSTTPLIPVRCPACGRRELRSQEVAEPRIVADPTPSPPVGHQHSARASPSRRGRRRRRALRRKIAIFVGSIALAAAVGYMAGVR